MTAGMRSQKIFQKLRNKKSIVALLSIVGIMIIIAVSLNTIKRNEDITKYTIFDILDHQSYFVVNDDADNNSEWDMSFDLKKEHCFGILRAIDSEGKYNIYKSKKEAFDRYVDDYLSIFKRLELSKQDIKNENFKIERDIKALLNHDQFSEEYPPSFEALYLNAGLKKVRITFNKDFLPIKVEGYYEETDSSYWELMRSISYPYKNQKEFDEALQDYIEWIEAYESEQLED